MKTSLNLTNLEINQDLKIELVNMVVGNNT